MKIRTSFIVLLLIIQSCSGVSSQLKLELPNLIPYRKGELWGFCDKNKKIIIPCKYSRVGMFNVFGTALVYRKNRQGSSLELCGIIDSLGHEIVPLKYDSYNFYNKIIPYDGGRTDKYGIYDAYKWKDLLIVITNDNKSPELDEKVYNLRIQNCFIKKSDDKKFKIAYDRDGNKILNDSLIFISAYPYLEETEYIIAKNKFDNKLRLYDLKGKLLNDLVFDAVWPWKTDIFIGTIDKKDKIYKVNGTLVNNRVFDQIKPIKNNMFIGAILQSGYGIYELNGEELFFGKCYFENEIYKNNITASIPGGRINYFNLNKKKFIADDFYEPKNFKFISEFMIVPIIKSGIMYFTIFNKDLEPIVQGNFTSINVDTVFKKIFLFSKNKSVCTDYKGNEVFSEEGVDTILPVSETRYFIEKATGCGIWSASEKKYIVQPVYKSVNYSLFSNYVLIDKSNQYIITDSNGISTNEDTYKKVTLEKEEVEFLNQPFREIKQLNESIYFSGEGVYSGMKINNSLRFTIQKRCDTVSSSFSEEVFYVYKGLDYFVKLRQYVASVSYLIAEKEDGTIFIIDGQGRKLMLGKNRVYVFKFGKLIISQAGSEINGRMKNSGVFDCVRMDGAEFPKLSFKGIEEIYYANGQMNMIIKNSDIGHSKKGLLSDEGKVILPMEYDQIRKFGFLGGGGFTADNKDGSVVCQNNQIILKLGNGIRIFDWYGEWGMAVKDINKHNVTGAVNKQGKVIIPFKYEIDYWHDNGLIYVVVANDNGYTQVGYYDINGNKYFE